MFKVGDEVVLVGDFVKKGYPELINTIDRVIALPIKNGAWYQLEKTGSWDKKNFRKLTKLDKALK